MKHKVEIDGVEKEIEIDDSKVIEHLKNSGKSVVDSDYEKNMQQRIENQTKEFKEKYSSILTEKEEAIFNLTGIQKKDGESTKDYEARVLNETKAKPKNDDKNKEIIERENSLKEEYEHKLAAKEEELNKIIELNRSKENDTYIQLILEKERALYSEDGKKFGNRVENGVLAEMKEKFNIVKEIIDEKEELTLVNKDGSKNWGSDHKQLTVDKFLSDNLQALKGKSKELSGSGSPGGEFSKNTSSDKNDISHIKTKAEFQEHCNKHGIPAWTKERDDLYVAFMENNKG